MPNLNKGLRFILSLLILPLILAGNPHAVPTAQVTSPFSYVFNFNGTLEEAGSPNFSSSPYWWLNSGAYLTIERGRGWTVQGSLPDNNSWRMLYLRNNPADTDQGYYPQNLFRLITRKDNWGDISQTAYFKITQDNLSSSPNRNESNGLLLFERYRDSNNLYYAGIRRDGAAVIKKKQNGIYYTLAFTNGIFPGVYDHDTNPNLLPINSWNGLMSEVTNQPDGSVNIKLFIDKNWNDSWRLVAQAVDNGTFGQPIIQAGAAGIRTDFMDVEFDSYLIKNIQP